MPLAIASSRGRFAGMLGGQRRAKLEKLRVPGHFAVPLTAPSAALTRQRRWRHFAEGASRIRERTFPSTRPACRCSRSFATPKPAARLECAVASWEEIDALAFARGGSFLPCRLSGRADGGGASLQVSGRRRDRLSAIAVCRARGERRQAADPRRRPQGCRTTSGSGSLAAAARSRSDTFAYTEGCRASQVALKSGIRLEDRAS